MHPSLARQQLAEAERAYAAITHAAAVNAAEANADYCGISSLEAEEFIDDFPSTNSATSRTSPSSDRRRISEQTRDLLKVLPQAPRRRRNAPQPIALVSSFASSAAPAVDLGAKITSWPAQFGVLHSSCQHLAPTPSPALAVEVATATPSIAPSVTIEAPSSIAERRPAPAWRGATLRDGPRSFSAPDKCPPASSSSSSSSSPTTPRKGGNAAAPKAATTAGGQCVRDFPNRTFFRGARAPRTSRFRRTLSAAHVTFWCSPCQCCHRSNRQSYYIKSNNFATSLSSNTVKSTVENKCCCSAGYRGKSFPQCRSTSAEWLQRNSSAPREFGGSSTPESYLFHRPIVGSHTFRGAASLTGSSEAQSKQRTVPGLASWLRFAKEWAWAPNIENEARFVRNINASKNQPSSAIYSSTRHSAGGSFPPSIRGFRQAPQEVFAHWPKNALFDPCPSLLPSNSASCYSGC